MSSNSSAHPVPYYAVIFTSQRTTTDSVGYAATAERMLELAVAQPGYLGVEDTRDDAGFGITISYWQDLDSIRSWRQQSEHLVAQQHGRDIWYEWFRLRVCRVERETMFQKNAD